MSVTRLVAHKAWLILLVFKSVSAVVLSTSSAFQDHGHAGLDGVRQFTNEWVVEITGGPDAALELAHEMGYDILGQVPGYRNLYRLEKLDHPETHPYHSPHLTRRLSSDVRVIWAEQQFAKFRSKRGYLRDPLPERSLQHVDNDPDVDTPLVRVKRDEIANDSIAESSHSRRKREDLPEPPKQAFRFNDELWDHQWYLKDTRTNAGLPRLDLDVLPVFDMGYTGKGVIVVVLDDGLEKNHTDLRRNYEASVSFDVNDDDDDPSPRYDFNVINSHGTRCAGEIAMEANNEKCGVGVAYNARIGGIRMLDGTVSDRVEGTSLAFAYDKVHIYSASWGPSDDGKTVEGPGRLAREALFRGITEGRSGKGAIYVWASGNGGSRGDNCNADGYTSSIYTLSVGSASEKGQFPWYGEKCASTIAVTYSSGAYTDQKIATTDLKDKCTLDHTGTSAAAPLAAGIVALALEANPGLTWRDVQHLVIWTSDYYPLRNNEGWQKNAVGLVFNLRFGFGLIKAADLVRAALNWTSVPPKAICVISADTTVGTQVPLGPELPAQITFSSTGCSNFANCVNYVEHVEFVATISYPHRGSLQIDLVSPQGTRTQVMTPRPKDDSTLGYLNWSFMSVHTWGERAAGDWTVLVTDKMQVVQGATVAGYVTNVSLILHGTAEQPKHLSTPKIYDDTYNSQQPAIEENMKERPVNVKDLRKTRSDINWQDLVGKKLLRDLQRFLEEA